MPVHLCPWCGAGHFGSREIPRQFQRVPHLFAATAPSPRRVGRNGSHAGRTAVRAVATAFDVVAARTRPRYRMRDAGGENRVDKCGFPRSYENAS